VALAGALAMAPPAGADAVADFYKDRTVTITIGFAPGGGADTFARFLSRHLAAHLPGKPNVIIQHMPGAGGLTALNHIYNTGPADGSRTILTSPSHTLAQVISGKNVRYDLLKMSVIGTLTQDTSSCAASGRSGIKTILEGRKREIIVGATGPNSSAAQQSWLLANLLGLKVKVVTGYRGTGPIRLAMETGEVEVVCAFWASQALGRQKADVESGKLVPIVQMGSKPHPALGKAPVAYDLAKSDEDRRLMRVILGTTELSRPFLAPPGVPAGRVAALRTAFWAAVNAPDAQADAKRMRIIVDPLGWKETVAGLRESLGAPKAVVERAKKAIRQ
jgi:tripartite-type tricarboxylate transporter receptor subunit TctC